MTVWLDAGLKTFVSVLILYLAVNSFWRYHPIAKARHVAALAAVSALIMFFFDASRPLFLLAFLGVGLVVEIVWFVWERRFKTVAYVLFLTDKAHQGVLVDYFQAAATRHSVDPGLIRFPSNCASILTLHGEAIPAWKTLSKEFERDFRGLVPILAFRAYVTVVLALILLAAYWRYW
jgi:hypothetical protein